MATMINFGIDLGTTNSLIAKFDRGTVDVFRNPNGFKEALPSVVGFRNDRILVGDQARAYAERDPQSVASRFKRKMGTSETFKIKSLGTSKSPVDLSAFVLKELKQFVHTGEPVEAAVITIPASFDTVQSNATKEAGLQAGFRHVILLQEPIAASLAFANKDKSVQLRNSQWIVYDLGGGTFDVALVRIVEGELTVVDHEGDNYLGGSDFDALIVERLVVPELERRGSFENLLPQLKSDSGTYNKLWALLLHRAEAAKIELSTRDSSEIDLGSVADLRDDNGKEIDTVIPITRSDLASVVRDSVDSTTQMMKRILTRNSLQPQDLKFILMVGGSTYIPYVRKRVEEVMGIPVNTGIDPTNAIAIGAAYFAGSKEIPSAQPAAQVSRSLRGIKVRVAYNRNSQELEEIFTAKIDGDVTGLHYRIVSGDGSFDSGLKTLSSRIVEDLPLREGAFNIFTLRIFDAQGNPVPTDVDSIQIAQGRYSVAGQMLPEDLSLVMDDLDKKDTRLALIFPRNTVLPTTGRKTVEVGNTVVKGSDGEIRILVVEGPSDRHASTNKLIGALHITGKQISRDLMKGTDIDLQFELTESRDLRVSAHLTGTGQSFSEVFEPQPRTVPVEMLVREIEGLEAKVQEELEDAREKGQTDTARNLGRLGTDVQALMLDASRLATDDVTDDKFKIDDRKRQAAQAMYELTSGKRLAQIRADYLEAKAEATALVSESGNDREKHHLRELIAREQTFLHSSNEQKLEAATAELNRVRFQIFLRTPGFLVGMFESLVERRAALNDQALAKQLIDNGRRVIAAEDWDDLREVNRRLWNLMPDDERTQQEMRPYTGIV
jgi:molecular chaperone DnaK